MPVMYIAAINYYKYEHQMIQPMFDTALVHMDYVIQRSFTPKMVQSLKQQHDQHEPSTKSLSKILEAYSLSIVSTAITSGV